MKKHWWKVALPIVALLVIAALLLPGDAAELTSITQQELVERLVVTGTIEPSERTDASAEVPGRVLRVHRREGDTFEEGDLLIELDSEESEASLRQAQANLEQAHARLRTVTAQQAPASLQDFEEATVLYEAALEELQRTEELVTAGVQPRAQLDQRRRDVDRARVALDRARTRVEESSPRGSAAAEASALIRQAQANRDLAALNLRNHSLRAPFDGILLRRHVERGQTVQPGTVLLTLAASGPPEIRIDPDEREIANLREGLTALVVADAFPDHTMRAEIDRINPSADRERATVAAYLRLLDAPPAGIRTDMTVSADIELRRKENADLIPLRALRGRSNQPYVLIVNPDDRAERRPVTLGLTGDDRAEILDGLSPSDQIILTSDIAEGDRVRR